MLIHLFPLAPSVWSFRKEPETSPIAIEVPEGSALLPVRSIGMMLFVPTLDDPVIRSGWSANQTYAEACKGGGRFRFVRDWAQLAESASP